VGDEQLSTLHQHGNGGQPHQVTNRPGDSCRPHNHAREQDERQSEREELGGRNRGLRGPLVSRESLDRRLTPHASVEHLASHRRLADERAGPT